MSKQEVEEINLPNDGRTQPNGDVGSSVEIHNLNHTFIARKNLFPTDHEVFVDSSYPLILLNDTNANLPIRNFYIRPRSGRKELLDSTNQSPESESSRRPHSRSSIRKRAHSSKGRDRDFRRGSITSKGSSGLSDTDKNDLDADSEHTATKSVLHDGAEPGEGGEVDVFYVKEEVKIKEPKIKVKIREFLDSKTVSVIIIVNTLYALFAQDLCTALLENNAEIYFDSIALVNLVVFTIEFCLACYAVTGYVNSFYFYMDIISTASIILDVNFIADPLITVSLNDPTKITRESLLSKIGTRFGNIIRTVRLVRLIKLYKQITHNFSKRRERAWLKQQALSKIVPEELQFQAIRQDARKPRGSQVVSDEQSFGNGGSMNALKQEHRNSSRFNKSFLILNPIGTEGQNLTSGNSSPEKNGKPRSPNSSSPNSRLMKDRKGFIFPSSGSPIALPKKPEKTIKPYKQSRVSRRLSELTMKRVILMTITLLLIQPLFNADFFFDVSNSQQYQMDLLTNLSNSGVSSASIEVAIASFINQQSDGSGNYPPLEYLGNDTDNYYLNDAYNLNDLRDIEQQSVTLNTVLLGNLQSICSVRYTNQMTGMFNIIRIVFVCTLLALGAYWFNKDANDLVLKPIESMIDKVNAIAKNPADAKELELVKETKKGFQNETIYIENAIIKIGGLLALGFGDAGSAIIGQNMAKSGDVNAMLPGKRKLAIYGFCDVHNFVDATETLQEDVMVFVNSIADVVHSLVDKYQGQANKNMGDAFLIIWKFPEDTIVKDDGNLEISMSTSSTNMADCSLMAFLKIYARINRDPTLLSYREDTRLTSRLPNYKIKMGFGLHVGWAIEGAIGSNFKIDASYLSPNVNIAARLKEATKQYGVPLLVSGVLYDMLSPEMQDKCRLLDIVTVKGSIKPIELYTVDMKIKGISVAKDRSQIPKATKRLRQKVKKAYVKHMIENGNVSELLDKNRELVYLLSGQEPEFKEIFSQGVKAYLASDWATAKKKFEQCLLMDSEDGPTMNLMNYLSDNDFIPPEDFKGCHILTEK